MPQLVSVDEILDSPDAWNAREACVLGFLRYSIEDVSIGSSKDEPRRLWVDTDGRGIEVIGFAFRHGECREVVIEGVAEIGKAGHFGMFPGQITHVKRIVSADQWFARTDT